jgi:CCR4-NOT transcription complex subunit 3
MAANRKLQSEIQQVLKKVEEGCDIFNEIWEKVYAAESQTLKEKYESDLKKEIKKLQRLRDQIKTWISSNEIKDKTSLSEAKRTIETKMEQFKICEKDTKTKAYSKEGLAREARVDPKEQLREEKRQWLNDCLEQLQDLVNTIELEKEKIQNAKGKNKNKDALEKCDNRIQKQKWHMAKIELMIKLIDNEQLDPADLDTIKDSLEYYIETAADDDGALGVEHEFDIYEDLALDSYSITHSDISPRPGEGEDEKTPPPISLNEKDKEEEKKKEPEKKEPEKKDLEKKEPEKKEPEKSEPVPPPKNVPAPIIKRGTTVAAIVAGTSATEKKTTPVVAETLTKPAPAVAPAPVVVEKPAGPTAAQIVAGTLNETKEISPAVSSSESKASPAPLIPSVPVSVASHREHTIKDPVKSLSDDMESMQLKAGVPSAASIVAAKAVSPQQPALTPSSTLSKSPVKPSPVGAIGLGASVGLTDVGAISATAPSLVKPLSEVSSGVNLAGIIGTPATTSASQSVASSAPALSQELLQAVAMLKQSAYFLPEPDQDKTQNYTPRNFYNTHPLFPTTPLFNNNECSPLFDKLAVDTYFFAFYFQQGSYQQYLAAKKLKKNSWRFHKKYTTWFQRHHEPKLATKEFEEGTYLYFDFESGWCNRIKSDFKFEYAFLEDEVNI